ncbi:TRAP transporter small permease [Oceanobacillus jeddahense]|uniref:TRAP transporter small permease subunit n=1 Tax=Oceanobacillus jeddahense TaxID=1462527 RepID=A0ABY5JU13_9BACI|nr:TRAP transporter small permease subunit [Oceanobacillus jeddahense]UUI02967.1 TRAP transporter small permease subunit [Oceanobacillus jeddahense]
MFSKIIQGLTKVADVFSVLMMILLAVTLFIGVLTRYVFSFSIPELEVVRNFCLIWMVFIGSALAVKEKLHLDIDIFSDYLSERLNSWRIRIVYLLTFFGIGILIFIGVAAFESGLNRMELVPIRFLSEQPSLVYYYSSFLVGSVLMLLFHLLNIRDLLGRNEVGKK